MNASTSSSERGKYVQSNGLCMYYEAQGAGTPVILLHGGLETCQMWAPVIPALSMHCQVITPDSRAHGRTDNPSGQFSYPLMAEDIALLIEALELHRPFVVGYSDGGQTALQMAITYPGLAQGYLIGAVYYSITTEWRQMMQGILGIEGSGRVDIERVIQTNPEFVRSLEAKHDAFHESGYWKACSRRFPKPGGSHPCSLRLRSPKSQIQHFSGAVTAISSVRRNSRWTCIAW